MLFPKSALRMPISILTKSWIIHFTKYETQNSVRQYFKPILFASLEDISESTSIILFTIVRKSTGLHTDDYNSEEGACPGLPL